MGNRVSLQKEEIKLITEETGFLPTQVERLYSRFASLDKDGNGSLGREDFLRVPELAINPLCDRIVHMFFADCDDDHERINFRQFMKILATFQPLTSFCTKIRRPSQYEAIRHNNISPLKRKHIRHSSLDGFLNYQTSEHYTTNQHNIHYVSSITQLNSRLAQYENFKKPYAIDHGDPPNHRRRVLLFMFKVYDIDNDNYIDIDDLRGLISMLTGKYISEPQLKILAYKILHQFDKDSNGKIDFNEFCNAFLDKNIHEMLKVRFPK